MFLNIPKSGNLQTKFYGASLVKALHSQNSIHRFFKSVEKIVYNFVHNQTLTTNTSWPKRSSLHAQSPSYKAYIGNNHIIYSVLEERILRSTPALVHIQ
jgi:hypothetical protein